MTLSSTFLNFDIKIIYHLITNYFYLNLNSYSLTLSENLLQLQHSFIMYLLLPNLKNLNHYIWLETYRDNKNLLLLTQYIVMFLLLIINTK